jgi:hypothetical protein
MGMAPLSRGMRVGGGIIVARSCNENAGMTVGHECTAMAHGMDVDVDVGVVSSAVSIPHAALGGRQEACVLLVISKEEPRARSSEMAVAAGDRHPMRTSS